LHTHFFLHLTLCDCGLPQSGQGMATQSCRVKGHAAVSLLVNGVMRPTYIHTHEITCWMIPRHNGTRIPTCTYLSSAARHVSFPTKSVYCFHCDLINSFTQSAQ
jgi:hypothetical protein